MGKIVLTGKGRRWVERGHPWVYLDDVADGGGDAGELLPVHAPDQRVLGWGLFSTHSRIAVRLVTRSTDQPDRAFWLDKVERAVRFRERIGYMEPEGACRLLAGDADGLPGFIVDRYADLLVVQSGCQASDRMRDFLLELVREVIPVPVGGVLDRSDTGVRKLENLEKRVEWLDGERRERVLVKEDGLVYDVEPEGGHKTGHYLDQRENRIRAAKLAGGRRVLDAFAYDGLFGIRAALAGAEEVLCLEQSGPALERLAHNAKLNGVEDKVKGERTDAMADLRRRSREGERFGLVCVDPPAFARNKREAEGAARGYHELNLRAIGLVEEEGSLVTSSCSHAVRREDFLGFLAEAAWDAGRRVWLSSVHGASPDHPHRLDLPETSYLKCAVARIGASL